MKKSNAILLIVAGGCVVLGTILCILAFTLAFFFPNQFSATDSYRTVNHTVTERFTSIRVEGGSDSDLLLLPAEDDQKYQVVSHERENMPYRVRVENGTLIITPRDERKWYDYISLFPSSNPKITVYLSEDIYDSLYVDSDTGDVETHGTLTFGDVDIRVSTGDVILKSQVSGTLNVKASTGNIKAWGINPTSVNLTASTGWITLEDANVAGDVTISTDTGKQMVSELQCRNLTVTCSTGGITCKQVEVSEAIRFQASSGKVTFHQVQCGSIEGETSSGSIVCEELIVSDKLDLEADTGDISLTRCDAASLEISTDTGDVEGSLLSEKIFYTETDTGSIRVPKGTSGGVCEVETDTGDIRFTIVE